MSPVDSFIASPILSGEEDGLSPANFLQCSLQDPFYIPSDATDSSDEETPSQRHEEEDLEVGRITQRCPSSLHHRMRPRHLAPPVDEPWGSPLEEELDDKLDQLDLDDRSLLDSQDLLGNQIVLNPQDILTQHDSLNHQDILDDLDNLSDHSLTQEHSTPPLSDHPSSLDPDVDEEAGYDSDKEGPYRLRVKYRHLRLQNIFLSRELEIAKATIEALRAVVATSEYHLVAALERGSELDGRVRSLELTIKRERINAIALASSRSARRLLSPARPPPDLPTPPRRLRSPTRGPPRKAPREEMSELQRRRALLRERSRKREEEQRSWSESISSSRYAPRKKERCGEVEEEEEDDSLLYPSRDPSRDTSRDTSLLDEEGDYPEEGDDSPRGRSPTPTHPAGEDLHQDPDMDDAERSLVGIAVDMLTEMSILIEEPDYTPNTSIVL